MLKSFELGDHLIPKTKKIFIQFKGSLNDFANNASATSWCFDNEYESEEVLLIESRILKIHSQIPLEVSITIPQFKDLNYENCMKKAHYIAFGNEVNSNLNEVLQKPSEVLNSNYLKEHRAYLPKTLCSDIVFIPNNDFCYIHRKNPIVKVINENSDALQLNLNSSDLVDENYFKVEKAIVEECAARLKSELETTFPIIHLDNTFEVKIQRTDGREWNDLSGLCDNLTNEKAIEKVLSITRSFVLILEITYAKTI